MFNTILKSAGKEELKTGLILMLSSCFKWQQKQNNDSNNKKKHLPNIISKLYFNLFLLKMHQTTSSDITSLSKNLSLFLLKMHHTTSSVAL